MAEERATLAQGVANTGMRPHPALKLPDTAESINPAPDPLPPPWTQVAFWVALASYILPIVTLVFHEDFSAQAQGLCALAAALSTVGWMVYQTYLKYSHHQATVSYHERNLTLALEHAKWG